MAIGRIDPDNAARVGWIRDQDNEVSIDGYAAFIDLTTTDGTSGFNVVNDIGGISFSADSAGDGYVANRIGASILRARLQASEPSNLQNGDIWATQNNSIMVNVQDGIHQVAFTKNLDGYRLYDAVVPDDYILPSAAFAAGATSVFVKSGTYVETADVLIPNAGALIGEDGYVDIYLDNGFKVKVDAGPNKETAGTISVTNGTTAVTGVGTSFTNLFPNDWISLDDVFYKILSITDSTNLTLVNTYNGRTLSGATYVAQTMFEHCLIQNISIHGEGAVGSGVLLRAALHTHLEKLIIETCENNLQIVDCGFVSLTEVESTSGTNDGIEIDGGFSLSMLACQFVNNGANGVELLNSTHGVIIDSCFANSNDIDGITVTTGASEIALSDCIVDHNNLKGINTNSGTSSCVIDGCLIRDNGGDGVDFDGLDNIITSCVVEDNGGVGIQGGNDGVITSNHIHSNTGNGITLGVDAGCVITSNHMESNGGIGLQIVSGDNNIVIGNHITGNTGDGLNIGSGAASTRVDNNHISGNGGTDLVNSSTSTLFGIEAAGNAAQGDVLYNNGTVWARLAAGVSGQFLQTQGAGANPLWAGGGGGVSAEQGFDGYVAFFTGSSTIAGDNDLFWDRATNRLGIHDESPNEFLTIGGTSGAALSFRESTAPALTANYGKLYVSSVDNNIHFVDSSGTDTDLTAGGGGGVTATQGFDGYIAFFTGSSSIAGDNDLFWDRPTNRLGIHESSPNEFLTIGSTDAAISLREASTPAGTANYGKIFVHTDGYAHFVDGSGNDNNLVAPFSDSAEASGNITTTSTSDVLATGMTLTPGAGTYMVWFSTSLDNTGANESTFVSIYSGGVQVAASERVREHNRQDDRSGATAMARVTVDGTQDIEVRWRVTADTGVMGPGRSLSIIRVS
jgi:hypothetical protein